MPMMKCGHASQGIMSQTGRPVCTCCHGLREGADVVDDNPPSLEGRKAKCSYCGNKRDSNTNLAFFGYRSDKEFDEYYCGCRGWD